MFVYFFNLDSKKFNFQKKILMIFLFNTFIITSCDVLRIVNIWVRGVAMLNNRKVHIVGIK
ncbi:hypothetical protein BpHYR1_010759 [Brachionus plicatilis]|uniref:Uncharacterized protein n=1 Tax=Brachionus plicatilis TaxID=10195 RepID=A0A3M7P6V7_BRAPC|nr:hypothetical protein BpHYR1_010759 [Brachionus plicatilis]